MRTPDDVRESYRIIGLMAWVVNLQQVLLALHVVNIAVAFALCLLPTATWLEVLGNTVVSCALVGTSRFASRYQRRLDQALHELLWRPG
jgi:hypothetical protein